MTQFILNVSILILLYLSSHQLIQKRMMTNEAALISLGMIVSLVVAIIGFTVIVRCQNYQQIYLLVLSPKFSFGMESLKCKSLR